MRSGRDYRSAVSFTCMLLPAGWALAQAAPPPAASALKRTQVYKGPVAAADHEAVGDAELLVDGQPPLKLKAGEGFSVPAGKVHDLRNNGKEPAHLIGVYVVEKGKPLATPAK